MNIVGLSAYFHEAACALLVDGRLIAAAEEERFSRIKHDPGLPLRSLSFCLEQAGLSIADVDCVAYYESSRDKLARQLWASKAKLGSADLPWLDAHRAERDIVEALGFEGRIASYSHHRSHAASAFYCSGFKEAAVLTVDGVGEWETMTYGRGSGAELTLFDAVDFPHSLGLFYATITSYLGFAVNSDEYKVMGLAPYGKPRHADRIWQLIENRAGLQFRLNLPYFDFVDGQRMYGERLVELLGEPPRKPEAEITAFHQDVAASAQHVLEAILLDKCRALHSQTGLSDLCMAGGVALNCVANGRILREGPFERLFVQPAAGDAGSSLGAALLAHVELTGEAPRVGPLRHVNLGPAYSAARVQKTLAAAGLAGQGYTERPHALLEAVVDRLIQGKVIGWFSGAMEFGPRALGARSILADPRDPEMRDRLNDLVKKREAFRPFAPAVLAEHARAHFELDHPSPFMLETCQVSSTLSLPAITHVDGSARPQTVDTETQPRFAALLAAFHARTGCPLLVNTSFNVRGEPIVESPEDALLSFARSGIDCLVIDPFIVDREAIDEALFGLLALWARLGERPPALGGLLYTFL